MVLLGVTSSLHITTLSLLARMVLLDVTSSLHLTTFSVTNGFVRCYVISSSNDFQCHECFVFSVRCYDISSYNDFQCHELLLGATAAVHATPAGGDGCGLSTWTVWNELSTRCAMLLTTPTASCPAPPMLKFVMVPARLRALVYDILPSTTAVFSYALCPWKLSANEQFFLLVAQTVVFVTNNSHYIRLLLYNWPCCLRQLK